MQIARLIGFLWLSLSGVARAEETYTLFNMPRGVTPISQQIFDLHMLIFWICVGIGVIVFGVLIFSLIRHRKSRGVKPAEFHEHPILEVVWAIIPFVILLAMAVPATMTIRQMNNADDADITIKITGYQWKWHYEYLDEGIRFFSNINTPFTQIYGDAPKNRWYLLEVDHPLVLPINKKVRFLVTSNDVIHSWWVPALGIKRDGIPGFINEAWARIEQPGTYRGQCAELCGVFHGFMPIVVIAMNDADYKAWMAKQKEPIVQPITPQAPLSFKDLMTRGEEGYNRFCSACHQQNGLGIPPVYPALKASSLSVGRPISRHIDTVLVGVPGTTMQSYANQLSDQELAEIITYERNAWGNNTGDLVQPADVQAERLRIENNPPVLVPMKERGAGK